MKRTEMKRGKPMARSAVLLKSSKPMNRGSPMKQASKPTAAVGQRAKRTRQGKVAPTAAEQSWMDQVAAFGCIVCQQQSGVATAAEIHHLKQGDRRMGHLFSIGLCYWHHRGGDKDGQYISRHPWKTRFEAAYGTELELLEKLRDILAT